MTAMLDTLFDKNVKTPGGMASELEIMRFFTVVACLKIVDTQIMSIAYLKLLNKLERV